MNSTRTARFALIALLAHLLLPVGAAAAPQTYVDLHNVTPGAPVVYGSNTTQTAAGPTTNRATGLRGMATGTGQSTFGSAKASVSASGAGFDSGAFAGWSDSITFDGGALNGQHGTVTFALNYSWVLGGSATPGGNLLADGFVDMNFGLGDRSRIQYAMVDETLDASCSVGNVCRTGRQFTSYYQGHFSVPDPTYTATTAFLSFDVVFGAADNFDVGINAFVVGTYASAFVDAFHSLAWQGIARVVDSAGRPVDYSVLSASGFDYAKPYVAAVSEPQPWMLLSVGLAAIACLRRRREL